MESSSQISLISLQEFTKDGGVQTTVPEQYIQESQEPATSVNDNVPNVDLALLIEGHDKEVELHKFRSICNEWGFFQVVNHGVNSSVTEKFREEIENFYKLPVEEKMRYKLRPGDVEGYGQTILHSTDEKVDWADRFYMVTNPLHRRKPHLLPELPPSLRMALELYLLEMQKLAMSLFGVMAEALRIEKTELIDIFDNGMQSMRMNYYPPCPKPEQVVGLRPHSDASAITILKQVNGVDGLQIRKDGVWVPVKLQPESFIVNIGDVLEILSNGAFNSLEHRATVNAENSRISIAMFFNPKFEAYVGPSPSLVSEENPSKFRRILMEDYVKEFFSRKLDGKTFRDIMKL